MDNISLLPGALKIEDVGAFLFDLDGVVVDSEKIYTLIWDAIDNRFPTGVRNFSQKIKGTTLDNILSTYFPDPALQKEVVAMLYDMESKMDYPLIEGASHVLAELKARRIPAALVTSSNQDKMNHLWERQPGLKQYFTAIVTADMVSRSKPDPEGYLKGASLLGVPPERCVVVEDSLQGVKAGRAAGARVIGMAGTLPADLLSPYADVVATDLRQAIIF